MAGVSFKGSNKGEFGDDWMGGNTVTFNANASSNITELLNNPTAQLFGVAILLIITLSVIRR